MGVTILATATVITLLVCRRRSRRGVFASTPSQSERALGMKPRANPMASRRVIVAQVRNELISVGNSQRTLQMREYG